MMSLLARTFIGLILSLAIAAHSKRNRSLDTSGALAAVCVGTTLVAAGNQFALAMLVFFFTSSRITKLAPSRKKQIESDFKEGGQRTAVQVFCNSFPAVVAASLHLCFYDLPTNPVKGGITSEALQLFVFGYFTCCAADTWSSEIGVLSTTKPFLVTTWARVPAGTNGAVSLLGLFASAAGGIVQALTWYASTTSNPVVILVGALIGVTGSLIDSLLGATLQFSGKKLDSNKVVNQPTAKAIHISGRNILTNDQVNLVSATLTGFLTSYIGKLCHCV
uniref:Transmembrane protein 19 n=1 Tax=Spongospora subterranea TaxID=70186 RepID=A0A0H5RLL1_9EUKA|eukprot:CRZ09619.1 hypothetical protein [Spongospora subterranea]